MAALAETEPRFDKIRILSGSEATLTQGLPEAFFILPRIVINNKIIKLVQYNNWQLDVYFSRLSSSAGLLVSANLKPLLQRIIIS